MKPADSLGARWRTFLAWGALSGGIFFAVYPLTNALAASRSDWFALWLPFELRIPFCPGWIWIYLSMHAMFWTPPWWLSCTRLKALGQQLIAATLVSGALFLALPARLGYTRVLPPEPTLRWIYERVFLLDPPHNLVPSLHVVWTALVAGAVAAQAPRTVAVVLHAWLWLIVASTLLTHQHHLLDLLVGFMVVGAARRLFPAPIDGGAEPQARKADLSRASGAGEDRP